MDNKPDTEDQQKTSSPRTSVKSYVTRSVASSSNSSCKSSASLAAAKARARAEAVRARSTFVKKETELMVEKAQLRVEEARMEAALATLKQEKEVAAALAEAEVLESAVAELGSKQDLRAADIIGIPPDSTEKRTNDYVECHSRMHSSQLSLPGLESHITSSRPRDFSHAPPLQDNELNPIRTAIDGLSSTPARVKSHTTFEENGMKHPSAQNYPGIYPCSVTPLQEPQPHTHPLRMQAAQPSALNHTGINDFAVYMARRELVTSGMTKFDDRPENYWGWKSTFMNIIEGLKLTCNEELDLLTRWLGPQSSEQVRRIRAVHVNDPAAGLRMAWMRLEENYGSPEIIEKALLDKLERFPKISNRDPLNLRELGDLLRELGSAKLEGCLPGLAYLDTSRGINPIVEKLPYGLQEKWMTQGSAYKLQNQGQFPPFSFFTDFVCKEARTRNDPSFAFSSFGMTTVKPENSPKRYTHSRNHVSSSKTEITSTSAIKPTESASSKLDVDRQCPIHKKPHPLKRCRGFRAKTLDERKTFLRDSGVCFRCCSSTEHVAKDCKTIIHCKECNSDKHVTALHPGPAPWAVKDPEDEHGGEEDEAASPDIISKCTEVCGIANNSRSCSKICLIKVHPRGQPERSIKVYAVLDDQSNRSLARSKFFDLFGLKGSDSPYTLRTCAGVTELSGRRGVGFVAQPLDGRLSIPLPTLIECSHIPDDRSEIPTPDVVKHHPHLKSITHLIPELDPNAQILLLLGRDVLQVHKVRDQRNGPNNAPYAQRLDLGWVVVGDVCLGAAHKPKAVNVYRTNVLENGRHSHFSPCPNHLVVKEKLTTRTGIRPLNSQTLSHFHPLDSLFQNSDDHLLGNKIFERTENDNEVAPSIEDKRFIQLMNNEMFIDDANSWVAPLPFRMPRPRLPNNRGQALTRFTSLCKTLERKPEMRRHFLAFMQNIFDRDHAEPAPALNDGDECWYLPSFGVYHPRKPGQIRVVFDSSAPYLGISLNDVLLTGPDLNNTLLGVLMRFRHEQVAITADIEQMFHSFVVREDHRNFLRFLWFKDNDITKEVVEYRMRVHVFGNRPSPAVATYGLRRAALHGEGEFGEGAKEFIHRNFYVDDALKSLPSATAAISLLKAAQGMLAISNLRLHKIASNCLTVMQAFPSTDHAKDLKNLDLDKDSPPLQRSLGLSWDLVNDTFTFRVAKSEKPFTRRGVLATINSLFDPLGLVAPVTIHGKLLLRQLTRDSSDWDAPLPSEKATEWITWRDSLQDLEQFAISRAYIATSLSTAQRTEIHIFSDASTKAIAAVAYLKVEDVEGKCHVGFIMGKAKLAPLPFHTIPRLELGAAVLAVEIAELLVKELDVSLDSLKFYTDSKVVLGYIYNESRRFYVYVSNRVERIRKFSCPEQWQYVHTDENPADVATRSVHPARLLSTNWLTGPRFLRRSGDIDSGKETSYDLIDPDSDTEVRSHITTVANPHRSMGSHRFERFSMWQPLVRAVASLIHIVQSFRSEKDSNGQDCKGWHHCLKPHKMDTLSQARHTIIGCVQKETYQVEVSCLEKGEVIPKSSPLRKLSPILDDSKLLRVGGRLQHASIETHEKHPLIIPGRSHIATLLVNYYHERVHHQGRVFTEGAIRTAGIWIVGAKKCISRNLHKCVTCNRLRGRPAEQKMANLPPDRLSTEPPFTNVGLDVFGPWNVSTRRTRGGAANSKRWAVLFTCLSVRAVHIELIESMDTSSFINALRRFFAMRGPVKMIRSDCGTNFKGACRELQILLRDETDISRYLSEEGCTWLFNPPHSSHMGGVWERMIGVSRRILDSMLSQISPSHLTHEVLSTLMAEVGAIINARPLAPISSDPDSPFLLTPAMILTQKVCTPLAPPGSFEATDMYRQQWKRVQHLANTFWERWRREYLSTLQNRSKWQNSQPNVKEGDLVLLKDPQVKRNQWPMALVTKAYPDSDGKVRKLELRVTKGGTIKTFFRPVTEVVVLLSI
ncbi:uncharacterized protein LOC113010547 [Astatotilapia calliptera]|uniref:uncharacterized protein LOC113010547 n=1 Tax=Astatotilapia calliptera TaxID=8154 RepID=UPI000E3FBCEE|nr:uncharacterized protein LOC113010547 [Astatotilapia calliptera]